MVRSLNKETKSEVFWPFEKKLGLENDYLRGKERWESERPGRQWERDIQDVFDNYVTYRFWKSGT